jgi:excisionase family DNA binding protein
MEEQRRDSGMLTTTEVAHLLHVHPNTVRHWANEGLLPAYRLGTRSDRRFKQKDVDNFIKPDSHKS